MVVRPYPEATVEEGDVMLKITPLILDRLRTLGQEVMTTHQELERWQKEPLSTKERTLLNVKHDSCLTEQRDWIDALEEVLEIADSEERLSEQPT